MSSGFWNKRQRREGNKVIFFSFHEISKLSSRSTVFFFSECAKNFDAEGGTQNHGPSVATQSPSHSIRGLTERNAEHEAGVVTPGVTNPYNFHRRKQSFDFCQNVPVYAARQHTLLENESSDWRWKRLRIGDDEKNFQNRNYINDVEHNIPYGDRGSFNFRGPFSPGQKQCPIFGRNPAYPFSGRVLPSYNSSLSNDKVAPFNGLSVDYRKQMANGAQSSILEERYFESSTTENRPGQVSHMKQSMLMERDYNKTEMFLDDFHNSSSVPVNGFAHLNENQDSEDVRNPFDFGLYL